MHVYGHSTSTRATCARGLRISRSQRKRSHTYTRFSTLPPSWPKSMAWTRKTEKAGQNTSSSLLALRRASPSPGYASAVIGNPTHKHACYARINPHPAPISASLIPSPSPCPLAASPGPSTLLTCHYATRLPEQRECRRFASFHPQAGHLDRSSRMYPRGASLNSKP